MAHFHKRWKPGDWYAICDVCGLRYDGSKLKLRWDGLRVCEKDFESRHPQDYLVVAPADPLPLPYTRPEPTDQFVTNVCTAQGRSCIVGYAVVGCSVTGLKPVFK